ncbi:DUF945 family protein [Gilvimarinus chinensis]|uniref:DUF945 family protein n=1 Tax=Gilvimarinus chinensis TaxID=396005 RepID=UPI0003621717|nr:DUF945 family protein [Gilvimarinus chinensis]
MKKWILLFLLVVSSYLLLTFYAGIEAERSIKQQLTLYNTQAGADQLRLSLSEYQRGFFKSQLKVVVDEATEAQPLADRLGADIVLWHGPFTFAEGFKPGWFYATGTLEPELKNAGHQQRFERAFAQGLGPLNLWGQFNGAYQFDWHIPLIHYHESGISLRMEPSHIRMDGTFNSLDAQQRMSLGAFKAEWDDVDVAISPSLLTAEVSFVAEDIPLTNINLNVAEVVVDGPYKARLQGIEYLQMQKLVNEKVDTRVELNLLDAESFINFTQLSLAFSLRQVKLDAIRAWAAFSSDAANALPKAQLQAQALKAARLLLHPDAEAEFDMAVTLARGNVAASAKLTSQQVPITSSMQSSTPYDLIKLLKGHGEVVVAEEVLTRSPLFFFMAELIATYMHLAPPNYVMKATLDNGDLKVNGQLVPLTALLPEGYW